MLEQQNVLNAKSCLQHITIQTSTFHYPHTNTNTIIYSIPLTGLLKCYKISEILHPGIKDPNRH